MHPSQLLHVRDRLATLDHAALRRQAPRLLRAPTHEDVESLLAQIAG
jgi:phosphotransferase system enzyme I (PtsI)